MSGLLDRLESAARLRFVHWDAPLWREIAAGPAEVLAAGLRDASASDEDARALMESYLRLAAHGIGNGYLFPRASTGAETFLSMAWQELVPLALPAVAAERRAEAMAECWNLGENLLGRPAWLDVIFQRVAVDAGDIGELSALVAEVERQVFDPPEEATLLSGDLRSVWIDPRPEDPHFLPGVCSLVAPAVLCVYDRLRTGGAGRAPVALGVWLRDEPVLLGPIKGLADGVPDHASDPGFDAMWQPHAAADRRLSAPYHETRNRWRAAASLWTSQQIVALLPA